MWAWEGARAERGGCSFIFLFCWSARTGFGIGPRAEQNILISTLFRGLDNKKLEDLKRRVCLWCSVGVLLEEILSREAVWRGGGGGGVSEGNTDLIRSIKSHMELLHSAFSPVVVVPNSEL